ncbi:hypothetical protein F8M41_015345 [Gigaspora margarita]|uniref:Uncharacterized protein n=1 Tax=Gigaspora margarita TaxID=4874 RepID=A0A8H4EUI6_GIGMA|nr:hypothetical protein F8M41_015345 [Gigaspora margarita]
MANKKKKRQKKKAKQNPLVSPLEVPLERPKRPIPDKEQKHHYIPRFILRNFAINNYERKFVMSPNYQHQVLSYKNNKYYLHLQTYNRADNQLGVSLIRDTYEYQNMYIDLNNEKVMHIENELSVLERKASKVIRDIIEKSQNECQISLLRKDLNNLRKFLFIMDYRKPHRCSQFSKERFNYPTWLKIKEFIQQCNLQNAREVWLQNIIQILKTPHKEVKDNPLIFEIDRDEYIQRMVNYYLVIWQAGESDEFLMTNNGFGIFEGITGVKGLPFQFAYHCFYVISPKLVLVLCHISFRKGVEFNRYILQEEMFNRSIFDNAPHPPATPNYVSQKDDANSSNMPYSNMQFDLIRRRDDNDIFTFPFTKITSSTVHLVNSILLNETHEKDLIVSFISPSYLYKTIVKYHKRDWSVQDFSNLKRNLFMTLNKTHESLRLRRNILDNHSDTVDSCNSYTQICHNDVKFRVDNGANEGSQWSQMDTYPLSSIRAFFSQWLVKLTIPGMTILIFCLIILYTHCT